jgi:spore coat protein U-like protein
MKTALKKSLLALALGSAAQASMAYNCTLNVTNVSILFSPTFNGTLLLTGSYSFSCTRTNAESATLNWDLAADNGTHFNGAQNRVQLGASTNRYIYELYRIPTVSNANRWQAANGLRFSGTLAFGSSLNASQPATTFYVAIIGPQTARPAGLYTDTVTATLRIDTTATVLTTTTFDVNVTTQNECQLTTTPGNINFNYQSLQTTAATASTPFQVRCTPGLPYSIAIDTAPSTLLGLNYTVVPSATGSTGTGLNQSFNINGTVAPNQAGTCAGSTCSATQGRTLTITY